MFQFCWGRSYTVEPVLSKDNKGLNEMIVISNKIFDLFQSCPSSSVYTEGGEQ